jgi:uncharacterized protein YndB with AHSA1/START domain
MSRNTVTMDCRPEDVFDILTDGWSYATWVVGAARIRAVDQAWPEVGARIHHSVGLWPVMISDTTSVERLEPSREIQLRVRAWPTGEGRVLLRCEAASGGRTRVTMEEWITSGPATVIPQRVADALLHLRNNESLRRLHYLAGSRARRRDDTNGDGGVAKVRSEGE